MIWFVFALMVAVVLALLLVPLFRSPQSGPSRFAFDLTVYKDQLSELDRDLDRGVLTPDQAGAARVEIQRRVLTASEGARVAGMATPAAGQRLPMAVAITLMVPLLSFTLYRDLGSPELPDQPYAPRAARIQEMRQQLPNIKSMVDRLKAHLQDNPDDGRGWAMLGRSLRVLGEPDQARNAFERALPLLPTDAQVRQEYASLLIEDVPDGAPMPPRFMDVMRELLAIDANNPDALYYVGVAEAEAGHPDKARTLWTKLLTLLPADSAGRAEVTQQLQKLGR